MTEKRRPNAPPAMRNTPRVGEVEQLMAVTRQTIAVVTTFRKCNKNSQERRAGAYRSRGDGGEPLYMSQPSMAIIRYKNKTA